MIEPHVRKYLNRQVMDVTTQEVNRERRLALLLADGTGDFDFVRAVAFENTVYLEGYVGAYEHKRRAEELARYVGFAEVKNALRIYPDEEHTTGITG